MPWWAPPPLPLIERLDVTESKDAYYETTKVCAVCGLVLNNFTQIENGVSTTSYLHPSDHFKARDHAAVPVSPSDIHVVIKCDMCGEEFDLASKTAWVIPCSEFVMPILNIRTQDFAACTPCVEDWNAGQWDAIHDRAGREAGIERTYCDAMLWALLKQKQTGEPFKFERWKRES